MSPSLRERREGSREDEREDQDDANGVGARGDDALDGKSVQEPDRHDEEGQDDGGDDHGDAGGDAAAVVVVDVFVVGFVSCFLFLKEGKEGVRYGALEI